jgi:hypothetical protein
MILFKINGIEYVLHSHIIKTMSIFEVLTDCNINLSLEYILQNRIQRSLIFEINWNISSEKVVKILHIVNDKSYKIINTDNLSDNLEIIAFMKYLGVSQNIMKSSISNMVDGSIINFISKCKDIAYDDNMMFIFDNFYQWHLATSEQAYQRRTSECFKNLLDKIISPHFPIKFQKKVIRKIVRANFTNYVEECVHESTSTIIKQQCDQFGCNADQKLIIKKINNLGLIRNQPIEYKKKGDLASYVGQVYDALAEHISDSLISRNR